jgi:hypothetical protein
VRVDIASPLIESALFSPPFDPKRARSLAVRCEVLRCEDLASVPPELLATRRSVPDTLSDTATDAPSCPPPPPAAAEEEAAREAETEAEAEEAKARSAWRFARCLELRTLRASFASFASFACWMSSGTALMCLNMRINVDTVIA